MLRGLGQEQSARAGTGEAEALTGTLELISDLLSERRLIVTWCHPPCFHAGHPPPHFHRHNHDVKQLPWLRVSARTAARSLSLLLLQ